LTIIPLEVLSSCRVCIFKTGAISHTRISRQPPKGFNHWDLFAQQIPPGEVNDGRVGGRKQGGEGVETERACPGKGDGRMFGYSLDYIAIYKSADLEHIQLNLTENIHNVWFCNIIVFGSRIDCTTRPPRTSLRQLNIFNNQVNFIIFSITKGE
jgi:hypothetical protein